jgi:hypothetical protein
MGTLYKTSDIYLAACLRLNNINLLSIEVSGSKGTFVFEDVDKTLLQNYDLGKMLVEPVAFNNAVKQLTTSVRRMISPR